MNFQKNRLYLTLAVFAIIMCIFITGCTSETSGTGSSGAQTEIITGQSTPLSEMPSGDERQMQPEMNGTERGPGGQGGMQTMDNAAAAEILGVTEDELTAALTAAEGEMPDFDSAAATLGVTVEELQNALGMTGGQAGDIPDGEMPQGQDREPPEGIPTTS